MLYPITFSIPAEKIVSAVPDNKTKLKSSLIPGNTSTYIYNNEESYYAEYRTSYFALTMKKGGWDCMRHYEILANGCIPYFCELEHCPPNTMALLPKELLFQGRKLYHKLEEKPELSEDDKQEYTSLANQLLDYTRKHLTTEAMARYVLSKYPKQVSRILFLSGNTSPDYLRCVTLHGMKCIFGANCHDYPKVPHIYKDATIDFSTLYGKGISYTGLLEQELHDLERDSTVENDICSHYYDIVIYGSYHRGMPFYELVQQNYAPEDILLLCGEDINGCNAHTHDELSKTGHIVFVREL